MSDAIDLSEPAKGSTDSSWVCAACGYHNSGVVCTHCGTNAPHKGEPRVLWSGEVWATVYDDGITLCDGMPWIFGDLGLATPDEAEKAIRVRVTVERVED